MHSDYYINRNLVLRGEVTLNEFLSFLGLEAVEEGDMIGWDCYIGEAQYGYRWIDFNHRHYVTDDGLTVCSIDTPFAPHSLDDPEYDGEDLRRRLIPRKKLRLLWKGGKSYEEI